MARKPWPSVALLALALAATGCAGKGNTGTSVDGSVTGDRGGPSITYFSADHRSTAGDVRGTTLSGAPLALSDYRGKYVVVNYWSATCGPCHAEQPGFEQAAKDFAAKGVRFVGIDEDDNLASARTYARHYRMTYPTLMDQSRSFLLDFPGAVPSVTPYTIVIDPSGGIAAASANTLDYTHLIGLLHHVMSEPT
ncbi:MAG TPA: TlpA disulfide reductase family protein [Mycobacteriales bacterium]|nr:TlpA disulfide reductase family protein [Mycobacteriales bacterium]